MRKMMMLGMVVLVLLVAVAGGVAAQISGDVEEPKRDHTCSKGDPDQVAVHNETHVNEGCSNTTNEAIAGGNCSDEKFSANGAYTTGQHYECTGNSCTIWGRVLCPSGYQTYSLTCTGDGEPPTIYQPHDKNNGWCQDAQKGTQSYGC